MNLIDLISQEEGFTIIRQIVNGKPVHFVSTPYEDDIGLLQMKHPALLHLEIYGKHEDPAIKYKHMKIGHDMFWPNELYHEWTKRRFMTHCGDYNYITWAAGANTSKSHDAGKLAPLFYWANPSERNVTIASVSLASLKGRVWGYLMNHMSTCAVPLPFNYTDSPSPKFLLRGSKEESSANSKEIGKEYLHGMFAVTAKIGDDDQAVATWIGKHPKNKLLVILDECTDMPMSIDNATGNLDANPKKFQLIGIGNSNSTMDLHGLFSTPLNGWESVSPDLMEWPTKRHKGICLYFSPHESPAITDPDPEHRKKLGDFLITKEILEMKEKTQGKDSEKFFRWTLGFWKSLNSESITISEGFLKDFNPSRKAVWSGFFPNQRVASLDIAFAEGGDNCIVRIADVNHTVDNKVGINLNFAEYMFYLEIKAIADTSVESRIGEQVIEKLHYWGIPLELLAIDITGQGRAMGEVITLLNKQKNYPLGLGNPLKLYSMSQHNKTKKKLSAHDIIPISTHELWNDVRDYIQHGHVYGMDEKARRQFTNRLILTGAGGSKRLETKREYKKRMAGTGEAHSPDEADTAALLMQVVKRRLGILPGTEWKVPEHINFNSKLYDYNLQQAQTSREDLIAKALNSDFSSDFDDHLNDSKPF